MGLRIGSIAGELVRRPASTDAVPFGPPPEPPADSIRIGRNLSEPENVFVIGRDDESEIPRAGFGTGSVSLPTASLRALDSNLAGARQIVPSIEELRAQARERIQDQQDLFARDEQGVAAARERPALATFDYAESQALAAARSRRFINSLNEAAAEADRRFGNGAAEEPSGPSIRINEETIPLRRTENTPRVDVFV